MAKKGEISVIEALLQPISKSSPCGEELHYDVIYDRIQDARSEVAAPQDETSPEEGPNWTLVKALCEQALRQRSKDLQIAVWLTEAWFYLEGLEGLERGLILLNQLVNKYWLQLFPQQEGEQGKEGCWRSLIWANQHLSQGLRRIAVTRASGRQGTYTYGQWWSVRAKAKSGVLPSDGQMTSKDFAQAQASTPLSFYQELSQGTKKVKEALLDLDRKLKKKPGVPEKLFSRFKGALSNIIEISSFGERSSEKGEASSEPKSGQKIKLSSGKKGSSLFKKIRGQKGKVMDEIQTREDAYYLLAQAADFLAQTEPHSPTPYLVRRAISWGGMSLDEVLADMTQEAGDITHYLRFLGLVTSQGKSGAVKRSAPPPAPNVAPQMPQS
ncbi:MAG: type VI secretion system protein TssA [bacterium]|nr:type VI secretion system protein TssA [bacterium]